jgi:hypothetical protein
VTDKSQASSKNQPERVRRFEPVEHQGRSMHRRSPNSLRVNVRNVTLPETRKTYTSWMSQSRIHDTELCEVSAKSTRVASAEGQAHSECERKEWTRLDEVRDQAIFMLDIRVMAGSRNAGPEYIQRYETEEVIVRNLFCFFPPEEIKKSTAKYRGPLSVARHAIKIQVNACQATLGDGHCNRGDE